MSYLNSVSGCVSVCERTEIMQTDRRTDGLTDGWTDKVTEFSQEFMQVLKKIQLRTMTTLTVLVCLSVAELTDKNHFPNE